jgi:hypothetical protein
MRVCFDLNVVFDILDSAEEFHFDSFCAYDVAQIAGHESFMPVQIADTLAYLLHRSYHNKAMVHDKLALAAQLFDMIDLQPSDYSSALNSGMSDFEDGLIAHSAKRNLIDLIVTRNKKDYVDSPVACVTPNAYVEMFKPAGIEYASLLIDE